MKRASLILLVLCLVLGCGLFRKAPRVEQQVAEHPETSPESTTAAKVSRNWNDAEARRVASEMMADCLSLAWIPAYVGVTGNKPVVTVAPIQNRTDLRIDTEAFTSAFEQQLSKSDQVSFAASQDGAESIREEDRFRQELASLENIRRIKAETGANFVLVGAIDSITGEPSGNKAEHYQLVLEMVNAKTMARVWEGSRKIGIESFNKKTQG